MSITFREFIARTESEDFNNPDEIGFKFADQILKTDLKDEVHCGDCIKFPAPCFLCGLSRLIDEFREYTINPEKYISTNYLEEKPFY